jgi:PAS domain S-box-containing protein
LVETATDYAIFFTDVDGHIIDWNIGAERILGYNEEEIVGQPASVIFTPEDREHGTPQHELAIAKKEGRVEGERWYVRKGGKRFWGSGIVVPLCDTAGELIGFARVMRDRTERRQAQEALEKREQQLQAILDNTAISVYIKDSEGRYLFVSRGFEQSYGRSRSEILGRTDFDLSNSEFAARFRAHDLRILELSEPQIVEEDVKTHDGRSMTDLSSKFPLLDVNGRPYATCGISTDITDRKRAETEIVRLLAQEQAARAEAEAANRAKDQFLAVLSHELRTPLTTTRGWLSLIRSKRLDAELTEQGLEAIEHSTRMQARLVEDLIDISKIISGKLPIARASIDLTATVVQVVETVHPVADEKGIELHMQGDDEARLVSGDPMRLSQIFSNLLLNAVKFTPPGGRIELQLQTQGAQAQIKICDTGEGIKRDVLPFIFDRFRQGDSSMTRRHGGLGLGLTLVAHLVELHGGTVQVDSPGEDQGTTVTVQLPLADSDDSVPTK